MEKLTDQSRIVDDLTTEKSVTVQEVVSQKPGFLVRYGSYFLIGILLLMITTSWFVRYPEIVKAKAKLASINAPKPVKSLQQGKLVKLLVKENQPVSKGELLGWVESIGSHEEVLALDKRLDSLCSQLGDTVALSFHSWNKGFLRLGELQQAYQTFTQALLTYREFERGGIYDQKRALLVKETKNLSRLHRVLAQQKTLQEQDLRISQKTFDANEKLNDKKVISDFDYRLEQGKLIGKKLAIPQINSAIINNENQQTAKAKERIELEHSILQQTTIFNEAVALFRSQLDDWKRKYILVAPIDGTVAFVSPVQQNQELASNQTVFYINPGHSQYFIEITIPQSNFGRVAVNQKVLIKFDSYPFQEFGYAVGRIENINHIPTENGYAASIILPKGLTTNRGKKIQYWNGLTAEAEIITNDVRLLQRLYNAASSSFRNER